MQQEDRERVVQKDIHYLDSQFNKRSNKQILVASLSLVVLIAAIEYITAYELAISIFFLIPIALATWYGTFRQGIFFCILAATACFLLDNTFSSHAYKNPFAPFWNTVDKLGIFLIFALLLSQLKTQLHIKKQLSRTDTLTGVMNGRGFTEASQQLLALAARNGRPTILAYIDLDNFRQMNEAFGHSEGDKALQVIAKVFLGSMRKTDVIGRLGGDEFAILLPETDATGARTKLGKLKNELVQKAKNHNWPIGFSMCVITFDLPPSLDEAFEIADTLMSEVKKNGHNSIIFEHFPKDANVALQA